MQLGLSYKQNALFLAKPCQLASSLRGVVPAEESNPSRAEPLSSLRPGVASGSPDQYVETLDNCLARWLWARSNSNPMEVRLPTEILIPLVLYVSELHLEAVSFTGILQTSWVWGPGVSSFRCSRVLRSSAGFSCFFQTSFWNCRGCWVFGVQALGS